MRCPEGSVSSFTLRIAATAAATATTSATASPAPTGGGAFCRMIGSPPSAAVRVKKRDQAIAGRARGPAAP